MPRFSVDDKMPFMEHLGELRTRIMRSLYFLLGGLLIAFPFSEKITDFLARPVTKLGYKLVFTAPAEAFWVQMKVALICGLFISAPGILYQVWAFIAPGLHTHERRYAVPFVVIGSLMFIAGGVLTPTPDAFNQTLMAGPLILLYEVGIICARIFGRRPAPVAQPSEAAGA